MAKIVQKPIDQEYLPIVSEKIKVDTVIDFDCYIKRFNDYVIIIEAGTQITAELLEKVMAVKKVYVHKGQRKAYKEYIHKHSPDESSESDEELEKPLKACKSLPAILQSDRPRDEQIRVVYKISCDIMHYYYEHGNEALPLEGVDAVMDALLKLIQKFDTLSSFTSVMPERYAVQSHAVNVTIFAIFLGRSLKLSLLDLKALALAGLLHDIGKCVVDKAILDKDDALSSDEFELVKAHSVASMESAREMKVNDARVLDAIKYHHEKLDGTGYPEGVKGKKIPNFAQILGICDTFDALTTERTFRGSYSSFEALSLMKREMAHQLNVKYINAFISLLH